MPVQNLLRNDLHNATHSGRIVATRSFRSAAPTPCRRCHCDALGCDALEIECDGLECDGLECDALECKVLERDASVCCACRLPPRGVRTR